MEALVVLVVLPAAIGIASELVFRDTTHASLAAAVSCLLAVFGCLRYLEPEGSLSWLAALLVSPFAIALSLAAVLWCFGVLHPHKRKRRNGT